MTDIVPGSEQWLASVNESIIAPDRPIVDPQSADRPVRVGRSVGRYRFGSQCNQDSIREVWCELPPGWPSASATSWRD